MDISLDQVPYEEWKTVVREAIDRRCEEMELGQVMPVSLEDVRAHMIEYRAKRRAEIEKGGKE